MRKRMLNKGRWTAMVLLLMLPTLCMALKPKWVGNTPKELNSSYKFMEITSYGTDIHSARIDALHMRRVEQQIVQCEKQLEDRSLTPQQQVELATQLTALYDRREKLRRGRT